MKHTRISNKLFSQGMYKLTNVLPIQRKCLLDYGERFLTATGRCIFVPEFFIELPSKILDLCHNKNFIFAVTSTRLYQISHEGRILTELSIEGSKVFCDDTFVGVAASNTIFLYYIPVTYKATMYTSYGKITTHSEPIKYCVHIKGLDVEGIARKDFILSSGMDHTVRLSAMHERESSIVATCKASVLLAYVKDGLLITVARHGVIYVYKLRMENKIVSECMKRTTVPGSITSADYDKETGMLVVSTQPHRGSGALDYSIISVRSFEVQETLYTIDHAISGIRCKNGKITFVSARGIFDMGLSGKDVRCIKSFMGPLSIKNYKEYLYSVKGCDITIFTENGHLKSLQSDEQLFGCLFSHKTMVTCDIYGVIRLININDQNVYKTFALEAPISHMCMDKSGKLLFVDFENEIVVYDILKGAAIERYSFEAPICKFNIIGDLLGVLFVDSSFSLVDVYSSKCISNKLPFTVADFHISDEFVYFLSKDECLVYYLDLVLLKSYNFGGERIVALGEHVFVQKGDNVAVYNPDGYLVQEIAVKCPIIDIFIHMDCFCAVTEHGASFYSLAHAKFRPVDLESGTTKEVVECRLRAGDLLGALVGSIKLNNTDLVFRSISAISVEAKVEEVVKDFPSNLIESLLEYVNKFPNNSEWVRYLTFFNKQTKLIVRISDEKAKYEAARLNNAILTLLAAQSDR